MGPQQAEGIAPLSKLRLVVSTMGIAVEPSDNIFFAFNQSRPPGKSWPRLLSRIRRLHIRLKLQKTFSTRFFEMRKKGRRAPSSYLAVSANSQPLNTGQGLKSEQVQNSGNDRVITPTAILSFTYLRLNVMY